MARTEQLSPPLPNAPPLPSGAELVEKIAHFLQVENVATNHRWQNVCAIYDGARDLAAQQRLAGALPVDNHCELTLHYKKKTGGVVQDYYRLTLHWFADGRGGELRLFQPGYDPSLRARRQIGRLFVGHREGIQENPFVNVDVELDFSGQGLGTGLGVCTDLLAQLWIDVVHKQPAEVEIVDAAHNSGSKGVAMFAGRNLRRNWTSGLVALGNGWQRGYSDVIRRILLARVPRYYKMFYPSVVR